MKPAELPEGTLTEDDYLALLEVIRHLHACRTRQELRACIGDRLLPLLSSQTAGWGWLDLDLSQQKFQPGGVMDGVGMPPEQLEVFSKMLPYNVSLAQAFASCTRPVLALDVDLPRSLWAQEKENFFADFPEYGHPGNFLFKIETYMGIVDPPDFTLGFGIHRFGPEADRYTLKEVRKLELVRPHLLQAVKTIYLREELKKVQALSEVLAQRPVPMALVGGDDRILFGNESFRRIVPREPGQKLPAEVAAILTQEKEAVESLLPPDSSVVPLPFVTLAAGRYRVVYSLLQPEKDGGNPCGFLRLKPIEDPYTRMTLRMQEAGLTPREMEVAVLVRDGMDDSEIAARLFIQPSTVQNHLKCIFRKMNVSSRPKLMAGLTAEPGPEGKKP